MADIMEEDDDIQIGLKVDGGALNRSGLQPEPRRMDVEERSMDSALPTMTPSISSETERTVIIEGVPESHQRSLKDHLENPNNGGGRLKAFIRHPDNTNNMIAVFAHRKVAENMLRLKTVTIVDVEMKISSQTKMFAFKDDSTPGQSLHGSPRSVNPALIQSSFDHLRDIRPSQTTVPASLASECSFMDVSMSDESTRTVVIRGVPETHRSSLKDFLRNPDHGGGRLKDFTQDDNNPQNMVAVFAHHEVAQNMLRLRTITVVGVTMSVCHLESRDDDSSSDDDSQGFFSGATSDTIKVFNIPPSVTDEALSLYFELKNRSGGGPIKRLQIKPEKRQALITFENADDAAGVAKRKMHKLADGYMDVVVLESDLAAGSDICRAIRVTGIDRHKLGTEIVSMYFENKGRSGGDEITDFFIDREVAVITFATPKVAQRVLSRKKHVLGGVELQVKAMTPCPPLPVYAGETEKNRLIVKGLPFVITLEQLSTFVEKDAGCRVTGWVLGSKKNSAMLEFDGKPNYAALRRLVSSIPLSGQMIGVQRVPLTTCLQVDGLSREDSIESLLTYFEKKTGAAPGTIRAGRKTETNVVLQFPEHSVMASVLAQQHMVKGQTLTPSPYSKELGCVLPEKASKDPPDNWLPRTTNVVGSREKLQVIRNNALVREQVEKALRDKNCVIKWLLSADLDIKLEQVARMDKSEDEEWSDLCAGVFHSILDIIVTRKLDATPEVWSRLKTQIEGETSGVAVDFNLENSMVSFSGFSDNVGRFEKKLKELKEEVEKQLEKEEEMKRRKVEVITTLQPFRMRYLERCGVADEVTKRFANLTLRVDEQELKLEGPEDILTEAKIFIYDSINKMESRFIDLTEDLTELITTEPTKTYVSDYLKQNGIKAIVEKSQQAKNSVTIHAISQEELLKASEFLTTDFVSEELKLDDTARHAMQTPDWQVLVDKLKQDRRFFRSNSKGDILVVSSRKDFVAEIVKKMQEVFEKHIPVEHFFSMKSSDTQLIGTFRKLEIDALGNKLRASAFGGKLKQVMTPGDASGFALKGNREEVEAAKKQLEFLTKSATESKQEITRPGVVNIIGKSEWKEFINTLQEKHLVILKTLISSPYSPSLSSNLKAGPLYETVINGHRMFIVLGDITDVQKGGALINPTNPRLELTHGLGLEIVKLGGKEIEEECLNHIKNSGALLPGTVFVSKAGSLLCDIIIHVIEPTTFDDQAVFVYQLAIKMALEEALRQDMEFVAFPLSFGAAFKRHLLFATIKEFFEKPESARLKTVQFVDDDAKELGNLVRQLKEFENALISAAVPGSPASSTLPSSASSPTKLTHRTPEGVVIIFHKGNICTLQADAIVNSTSKTLALGNGGVSKAILFSAGPEIQRECQEKAPNGLSEFGEVLATKAYKLACKVVYHGAAVQWDNGAGPCEKVLRQFVSHVLTLAHRQNLKSIAIPAVGSGTLKVPHNVVVDILLEEIFKFSKTYPGTSLRTIYTVAYEQNQPSVAAFEKKFLDLQLTTPAEKRDFGQTKGLQMYNEKLTILISALSQSAVQQVQSETAKFIDDASEKRSFEIMNALTDEQLDRINLLQVVHTVRITLSNGKIDIQGLKDDVRVAVEKIKYILKDT